MIINQLQNEHRKITNTKGSFGILESLRDESVSPTSNTLNAIGGIVGGILNN